MDRLTTGKVAKQAHVRIETLGVSHLLHMAFRLVECGS